MRLVAFDPGHVTGIAVFDDNGEWTMGLTVSTSGLTEPFLRHLSSIAKPDIVIIESPPSFSRDVETDNNRFRIEHYFKLAGYMVEHVNPGQWKGMVDKESISGQHQVDAATMGRWWLRAREGNTYVEKRPRSRGGL